MFQTCCPKGVIADVNCNNKHKNLQTFTATKQITKKSARVITFMLVIPIIICLLLQTVLTEMSNSIDNLPEINIKNVCSTE